MERPSTMDRYASSPRTPVLRRTKSSVPNVASRKASIWTLSSTESERPASNPVESPRLGPHKLTKKRTSRANTGNPVPVLPEQPEIERMVTPGVVYIRAQPSVASLASKEQVEKPFLQRIFHRTRSQSEDINGAEIPYEFVESSSIHTMTPSPNTHPLLSTPLARDEHEVKGARSPAESVCLNTGISTENGGLAQFKKSMAETPRRMTIDNAGQSSPKNPTMEERCSRDWPYYIKCYSEGQLDLSRPPQPPKRLETKHFSAPLPPNEKQRLKAAKTCNVSLPTNSHDKYHRMTLTARNVFQTRMAAITLIDENVELLKAEHAVETKYVNRSESFGSHVLLSTETMVVLDSWMDWRFRNNPLVQDGPRIRFYAGAPLVTKSGDAVGTFAVFDTQPRATFPEASRKKLMEFAQEAMAEIDLIMEEREVMKKQMNHTLYKIMGRSMSRSSFASVDPEDVVHRSRRYRERFLQDMEGRPATTPEISEGFVFPSGELPSQRNKTSPPRRRNTTDDYTVSFPKDSNGPDVSITIHNHDLSPPPPPPRRRNSLEPSLSLAMESIPERKTSAGPKFQSFSRPFGAGFHTPPVTPRTPYSFASDSALRLLLPEFSGPITTFAEATVATSSFAHSLNFDLIYFLRVNTPSSDTCTPVLPGDAITSSSPNPKVLISHGLPNPQPIFDAALHIRALRSSGGLVYQNPAAGDEKDDVGFQIGILLPLVRDGEMLVMSGGTSTGSTTDEGYGSSGGPGSAASTCSSGIVIAAFTKRLEREQNSFTSDEVRSLKLFGEAVKDVLTRPDIDI